MLFRDILASSQRIKLWSALFSRKKDDWSTGCTGLGIIILIRFLRVQSVSPGVTITGLICVINLSQFCFEAFFCFFGGWSCRYVIVVVGGMILLLYCLLGIIVVDGGMLSLFHCLLGIVHEYSFQIM